MYYAYDSNSRDAKLILASEVVASEQNKDFYCPGCRCVMKIRSINSNKYKPNFFKLPSSEHSQSCFVPYIYGESGNKEDYKLDTFEPDDLLNKIIENRISDNTKAGEPNINYSDKSTVESDNEKHDVKEIKTIRQLYNICASNDPSSVIREGLLVKDIYAGRSTVFLYNKYINGTKLVECRFQNRYEKDSCTLYFGYPYYETRITLKVQFESPADYKDMRNKLWDSDKPVIIYAKWNYQSCQIKAKRQIVPLKKQC